MTRNPCAPASSAPGGGRALPNAVDRVALRTALLAARRHLPDRAERTVLLVGHLRAWLEANAVRRLAFYWPMRGEPDLRGLIAQWLDADRHRVAALPVIEGAVLRFAPWTPHAPMRVGAHGVAIPDTARRVRPRALLIPCVGIDAQRHRLGYGGGYYDRTLAALRPRPLTLGVAFDCARVASIDPQGHDIALDAVATESRLD